MKLGIYTIINDPIPKLFQIKTINVEEVEFKYIDKIVNIFRKKLFMDKLDSEFCYALSLTYGLIPRGIILLGVGNNESHLQNLRELGIGLLLTGGEQFMIFHNHPGKNKTPSESDYALSNQYRLLGNTIGIEFKNHIMIAGDYYEDCVKEECNIKSPQEALDLLNELFIEAKGDK